MMHVLRRYIRETGSLFFTVFLNERSETAYGAHEQLSRAIEAALADGRIAPDTIEALKQASGVSPDFIDVDPEHPLRQAMYSRKYRARADRRHRLEGHVHPAAEQFAQHQIICTPTAD